MDLVEEFLELTKNETRLSQLKVPNLRHAKVAIVTLVKLLRAVRRRVPGRQLPPLVTCH